MTNPFEKVPGGKPSDAPKGPNINVDPPPGALCPFLGGVAIPMIDPDKAKLIKPNRDPLEALEMGISYSACQQDRCRLWHAAAKECSVKVAAFAQIQMARDLSALLKKLG
jgi:hypothetical protein